jgi:SAM-dependent MidA family methyltransferase
MDVTPGLRRVPAADLGDVGEETELAGRIRAEILARGPMTFARFMELALYDPDGGYYRGPVARPGREGDFLTAPETHPIFGWALAAQLDQLWDAMARPPRFVVREHGAGAGALALAVLDGLARSGSALLDRIVWQPVEIEPQRAASFRRALTEAGRGDRLEPATDTPVVGVVLANEVLDALPVHRVVVRDGELREVLVGVGRDGGFADVEEQPTTGAIRLRLAGEGIELAEGQRAEVSLGIDDWVARAARSLERGLLLLVDYGYPATELYDPDRRRDGTLRAYVRHVVHDDPYRHIGRQDLTAHVDVSAVTGAAVAAGLRVLGVTTQAEFLAALGAGELLRGLQDEPATTLQGYLDARAALGRMLDPAAMGRFRVMAFGRGLPAGTELAGLRPLGVAGSPSGTT